MYIRITYILGDLHGEWPQVGEVEHIAAHDRRPLHRGGQEARLKPHDGCKRGDGRKDRGKSQRGWIYAETGGMNHRG
jgi:hypothetical protein